MALKVELKPSERIIIGTVVIKNGETRTRFFVEGHAPILREKDILTPRTADTPAKLIYLAVQLMYLDGTVDNHKDTYFRLVHEILEAAPSTAQYVSEINNRILSADFYKALKVAKDLIAYEKLLLDNAKRSPGLQSHPSADLQSPGA
jgi:flagellar biosynthesis repressor protein FlbT